MRDAPSTARCHVVAAVVAVAVVVDEGVVGRVSLRIGSMTCRRTRCRPRGFNRFATGEEHGLWQLADHLQEHVDGPVAGVLVDLNQAGDERSAPANTMQAGQLRQRRRRQTVGDDREAPPGVSRPPQGRRLVSPRSALGHVDDLAGDPVLFPTAGPRSQAVRRREVEHLLGLTGCDRVAGSRNRLIDLTSRARPSRSTRSACPKLCTDACPGTRCPGRAVMAERSRGDLRRHGSGAEVFARHAYNTTGSPDTSSSTSIETVSTRLRLQRNATNL